MRMLPFLLLLAGLTAISGASAQSPSPTGRIVFSAGTDDVYVVNADGTGLRRLTRTPGWDFDPSWSPDGRRIVFRHNAGENRDDIVVMNAVGSGRRVITAASTTDWGPDWSPDGRWIAYNSTRASRLMQLHVMHPDGTGKRRVSPIYGEYPTWSPDGRRLAFMSQTPEGTSNYEIWVVNVDGSGLRRLTRSFGPDGWPAWSPDGTRIAFSSVRDDCGYSTRKDCLRTNDIGPFHTLYVMNADGSGQRRLSRVFAQFPEWSPDGRFIVFAPFLNVIRPDGTGFRRIPVRGLPAEPEMPDWTR